MSLVMLERVIVVIALLGGGVQRELATVFGSSRWDAANPNSGLACYHRQIDDDTDVLVAHKTLPCRSRILVVNPRTGRASMARVGDRGPRHAGLDLSTLLARRLEHNGREPVLILPLGGAVPLASAKVEGRGARPHHPHARARRAPRIDDTHPARPR